MNIFRSALLLSGACAEAVQSPLISNGPAAVLNHRPPPLLRPSPLRPVSLLENSQVYSEPTRTAIVSFYDFVVAWLKESLNPIRNLFLLAFDVLMSPILYKLGYLPDFSDDITAYLAKFMTLIQIVVAVTCVIYCFRSRSSESTQPSSIASKSSKPLRVKIPARSRLNQNRDVRNSGTSEDHARNRVHPLLLSLAEIPQRMLEWWVSQIGPHLCLSDCLCPRQSDSDSSETYEDLE